MSNLNIKINIRNLLIRLFHHLGKRRKRQLIILLLLMVASALSEVVSLGLVIPFLGVLMSPDKVFASPMMLSFENAFAIKTAQDLVFPITMLFISAVVISASIRVLQLWASSRLMLAIGSELSVEVYRRILYQNYQYHIARNSSEMISGITGKVDGVVFWILTPAMTLLSSGILFILMVSALVAINPVVALISIFGFGLCYWSIIQGTKKKLKHNSELVSENQNFVIKALQEGLGGIREVLLDGTQATYCDVYQKADYPLRYSQGSNVFIGVSPRYIMESMGMILIICLSYWLSRSDSGISAAIPTLGALAIGAQRILPALQQGYNGWTSILGGQQALSEVLQLIEMPIAEELLLPSPEPLDFRNEIKFSDIYFRYNETSPFILNGFNLTIKKGSRVGLIGTSGSGKSTASDLLMGLLKPTKGQIFVDDKIVLDQTLRSWQKTVANVPQFIFLTDASVAENIAFGTPKNQIDMERVKNAARQAQIGTFIEDSPKGYETRIGERGIRLSGGQRQRIGIARALYKRSSVIVFDEATSALDHESESNVMAAIENLSRDLTILIIAHRHSTLKSCDKIIEIKNGKAIEKSPSELESR